MISASLEDNWNSDKDTTAQGTICFSLDPYLKLIKIYEIEGEQNQKFEKKQEQQEEFSEQSIENLKPLKNDLLVAKEHQKRKLSEVKELEEEQIKSHIILIQDEEFNKSSFLSSNGKASSKDSKESFEVFTNYSCPNERSELDEKIRNIAFPQIGINAFTKYNN